MGPGLRSKILHRLSKDDITANRLSASKNSWNSLITSSGGAGPTPAPSNIRQSVYKTFSESMKN